MPASENSRRNLQVPVLEHPSLPDHDRTHDPGMHSALPEDFKEPKSKAAILGEEEEIAPPDQEFAQILRSGPDANQGRIPDDPNNALTSEPELGYQDLDPENRGDSLPDMADKSGD